MNFRLRGIVRKIKIQNELRCVKVAMGKIMFLKLYLGQEGDHRNIHCLFTLSK